MEPSSNAVDCFWGVELSGKNKTHLFEEEGEEDLETVLELRQACLGADAKEGRNVVQITSQNEDDEPITHTLLSMRIGGTEMAPLFITLRPPSKLELVKGNGPVHIMGTTITTIGDLSDDEDEEEEDEEETVPDDILAKKGKKRSASPVNNPTKIARMIEAEAEEDSDEEEEDDEDEEEGSDEDEEDGEDEEELERFQKPAMTKKGAKKATLVEEMDDDESMSDEDEDGGESEEEEEMEILPPKSKKQSQSKPQFKTPQAQKSTLKSSLKSPASAPKPKKGSEKKPAGKPTGALSINEIKKKLATSPNLPKKLDKFNNYMSNNFKVSDASVKKQLWEFVQKSKK